MKKYAVKIYGDPVLRKPVEPIDTFDESLEEFAADMVHAMIEHDGIGLAAPQVGVSKSFIVIGLPVNADDPDDRKIFTMANPEILEESEETVVMDEGCLSIPDITEEVERPEWIKLKFQDLKGEEYEIEADGIFARVIQHEIDHLDGVLFVDHLSPLKRTLLRGKLKRLHEDSKVRAEEA
ncbi:peptide deformylase [bacterium]|nr:peptide deformylase [bacterium]